MWSLALFPKDIQMYKSKAQRAAELAVLKSLYGGPLRVAFIPGCKCPKCKERTS